MPKSKLTLRHCRFKKPCPTPSILSLRRPLLQCWLTDAPHEQPCLLCPSPIPCRLIVTFDSRGPSTASALSSPLLALLTNSPPAPAHQQLSMALLPWASPDLLSLFPSATHTTQKCLKAPRLVSLPSLCSHS